MKLSARNTFQKGFTLIELLVVIGILGILAAALVATIDPFEQLRKGTDARVENTVIETQNALLRYYTIRGTMPWDVLNGDNCIVAAPNIPAGAAIDPTYMACVTALIDQGELRSSFENSTDLANIHISVPDADDPNNVVICYRPESKAKQNDPNTSFDATGAISGTQCENNGGDTQCYWCSGDVAQAP